MRPSLGRSKARCRVERAARADLSLARRRTGSRGAAEIVEQPPLRADANRGARKNKIAARQAESTATGAGTAARATVCLARLSWRAGRGLARWPAGCRQDHVGGLLLPGPCADMQGLSLHAAVRCGADDRQALEHLCRYITRSALANGRVQTNAAGQVVLKLKTPWRDGTTHLVMSPLEFMQIHINVRLVAGRSTGFTAAEGRQREFGAVSSSHWTGPRRCWPNANPGYVSSNFDSGRRRRCRLGGSMTAMEPRP